MSDKGKHSMMKISGGIVVIAAFIVIMIFLAGLSFGVSNTAPVWKSGAMKTESATITCGNPYTPVQFITSKWADADRDKLEYFYSVNDGEPQSCADYMGTETQVQYFAYTPEAPGEYTIRIWASDGKARSEDFVATVTVVDPETYEYTMTVKVAPREAKVNFYKCSGYDEYGVDVPGEQVKAKSVSGTDGYRTYTMTVPKGTYSFRGIDSEGNDLGGMTFDVPNVARTAGSSERGVVIRQVDIACNSTYDEEHYCTADMFLPSISHSGRSAKMGSWYVNSVGKTVYRTMIVAAGNDRTYQTHMYATEKTEKEYGLTDGWIGSNYTLNPDTRIATNSGSLNKITMTTFHVSKGSDVRLFLQNNYFNQSDLTERRLVTKKDEGNGGEAWTFELPANRTGLTYRVMKKGMMTRVGFVRSDDDITVEDNSVDPDSHVSTAATEVVENSVLLNVNSRNSMDLKVGESFQLKAYRIWEIVGDIGNNMMMEPDFHTEILQGNDVLEIQEQDHGNGTGNWIKITGKKKGIAILKVTYDAIDVSNASQFSGQYGACNDNRSGIVVVNVDSESATNVEFGLIGSGGLTKEWDAEFDTAYFLGAIGEITMRPKVEGGEVSKVEVCNDVDHIHWDSIPAGDGDYRIPLKDGNNLIRVTTDKGGTAYQVVRGCRYSADVTNVSRPGEEPAAGDELRIHLNGLHIPVPKMAGVYNPGFEDTGTTIFIGEDGKQIKSPGSQYNFISKQNLTVNIPNYGDGDYVLSKGYIFFSVMAGPNFLGEHRYIPDSGLSMMFNAVSGSWKGCSLEDVHIALQATGHGIRFEDISEGGVVTLKNQSGNTLSPDQVSDSTCDYENLPGGTYTYTFCNENGSTEEKAVQIDGNSPAVTRISAAGQNLDGPVGPDHPEDPEVERVQALIIALPSVSELTLQDAEQVSHVQTAYSDLSPDRKSAVGEKLLDKLESAVNRISALEREKENREAVSNFEEEMRRLPAIEELQWSDRAVVEALKAQYEKLTREQKSMVADSLKLMLQDADEKIESLRRTISEEECRKIDNERIRTAGKMAVSNVVTVINAKSNQISLKYKKASGAEGYLVEYRLNGKGRWIKRINGDADHHTISGLQSGVCVEIRITPFLKVEGNTYYGRPVYGKNCFVRASAIKKIRGKRRGFKITLKRDKSATGYQINYSMNTGFKPSKTKNVRGANKVSIAIKKLDQKTNYFVRVREYKKIDKLVYYAEYSNPKIVNTK